MVIIHSAWLDRFGFWSVNAFAKMHDMKLVFSTDRKRLWMVAK